MSRSVTCIIFTVQNYTNFPKRNIENRTSSLQMGCKFIATECKKHCKLYKTCKEKRNKSTKKADFIEKSELFTSS